MTMLVKVIYSLAITVFVLSTAPRSQAASLKEVQEVARWFTGMFNNSQQVSTNPTVPLISMSNCSVELVGGNWNSNAESIYLEQNFINSAQPPRIRYYEFSQSITGVLLGIRSLANAQSLAGLCNRPVEQRMLNFNDIIPKVCEVELFVATNPRRYIGTNAPLGCPAASNPFLTVISSLTIEPNRIDSLDQGFIGGVPVFGTPITFNRVPEPNVLPGLMVVGFLGLLKKGR
jgi:hypothetical protein